MEKLFIADLGPGVDGWAATVDGDIVCLASPRVEDDLAARRSVRELVTRAGGNCAACRGCIIARDDN
ncbi:hypothetical protein [Streptomyces sp. NPDC020983]|uniref:hypothetical protein n=1 Tax=Streptomyces sp. NPDC020983 TaxID=3365106 RepID=UPI0037A374ED